MTRRKRLAAAGIVFLAVLPAAGAQPRFNKVSDRISYLRSGQDGANVAALVTGEGVLLVDTPVAREIPAALEALKRLTPSPVRWVVNTHHHADHTGGNEYFLKHNGAVIGSRDLRRLIEATHTQTLAPQFAFGRQMRIFPGGVEVRILSVEHPAHTGGDVVLFVPSEKVLLVGDIFVAGSFPVIDMAGGGGSPAGWFDAMRKVIESVPLVRSAMPQPKPGGPKPPEEEKTLEELVLVIPGHGLASNLKEMKDLLEAAQRLRNETSRAIAAGRSREAFLSSAALAPFHAYKNFDIFAAQLFEALSKPQGREDSKNREDRLR